MSYDNPTELRIGASGTLDGHRCRVAGRAVLGTQYEGETYYWNEFNLVDESGNVATLVYEETDDEPEWKLFIPFEPLRPMSAGEAAGRKVGDTVNLDGKASTRITLVGQSRVYHIEGAGPEDEDVGDVASYFNSGDSNREIVVSWTGDEVEYYRGRRIPVAQLTAAFGLPAPLNSSSLMEGANSLFGNSGSGQKKSGSSGTVMGIVVLLAGAFMVVGGRSCARSGNASSTRAETPKQAAPATRIAMGARGVLDGIPYLLEGRTQLEVAGVGRQFEFNEYNAPAADGGRDLLIQGLTGAPAEWHLLHPIATPQGVTAYDAAAYQKGSVLQYDGGAASVAALYRYKPAAAEGKPEPVLTPQKLFYGFIARTKDEWILARWSETSLEFFSGHAVPEQEVVAAFKP